MINTILFLENRVFLLFLVSETINIVKKKCIEGHWIVTNNLRGKNETEKLGDTLCSRLNTDKRLKSKLNEKN